MSHIGIFGGTFDPIHNGHLETVKRVLDKRNLDKIIFMPSFISPFKTESKAATPEDRINMVNLAIEGIEQFECSDFEIQNEGISFTIKTLEHFRRIYEEIDLIIGYDNIVAFHKWKNPDLIFKLANVVVMKREIDTPPESENEYMPKAIYVDTPLINISSTEIRERVKNSLPIENLVPDKVKSYILTKKLYHPKTL